MRKVWLASLVPALLFMAGVVLTVTNQANPIIYLRANLGILLMLGSGLLLIGLAFWLWEKRRQQQGLLQQRQLVVKDRQRFLQRLDHELKNPLTAIRVGLAHLDNGSQSTEQQSILTSIEAQAVRLSQLTAELRKLAELETRPLERRQVDLTLLLAEALALIQERPGADGRSFALTLPQAPWPLSPIFGDWDLIYLAVYNLLDNALKYSQPGDTIELRAREDGAMVVLEVADTGPGIVEEVLPHVWEELYRGDDQRHIPGSGLGLSLVKAIAERHGGATTIHSRANHGTVISMTLPVAAPE